MTHAARAVARVRGRVPGGPTTDRIGGTAVPQPALLAHDVVRSLGGRRVLDGVSLTASPATASV